MTVDGLIVALLVLRQLVYPVEGSKLFLFA